MPGTNASGRRRAGAVLLSAALLAGAPAARSADPATAALGALTFRYDPERWAVSERDGALRFACRWRHCDGVAIDARHEADDDLGCPIASLDPERNRPGPRVSTRVLEKGELTVTMLFRPMGCRNARPLELIACARHRDRTYRFSARHGGCRGGPSFGFQEVALDLLDGLSAP